MATGKLLCTLPPGPSKTGYVSSLHSGNSLPKATSAWDPKADSKPVAVLACFSAAVTNTDQEQPGGEKAYLAYRGQSVIAESPCRNSGQEPKYKPERTPLPGLLTMASSACSFIQPRVSCSGQELPTASWALPPQSQKNRTTDLFTGQCDGNNS